MTVPWRTFRAIAAAIVVLAATAILADPRYVKTVNEEKRDGIDVVFVLDLSKSMLAEDVLPNRLDAAKKTVADFVSRRDGDRF